MNIATNPSAIRFGNWAHFDVGDDLETPAQNLIKAIETETEADYTPILEKAYAENPEEIESALKEALPTQAIFLRRTGLFLYEKTQHDKNMFKQKH